MGGVGRVVEPEESVRRLVAEEDVHNARAIFDVDLAARPISCQVLSHDLLVDNNKIIMLQEVEG